MQSNYHFQKNEDGIDVLKPDTPADSPASPPESELQAAIGQKLSDVTNYITSYGKIGTTYDEALDAIVELLAAQKQRWEATIRLEAEKGFKSDLVKLKKEYFTLDELIRSTDHGIERYTAALDAATGGQENNTSAYSPPIDGQGNKPVDTELDAVLDNYEALWQPKSQRSLVPASREKSLPLSKRKYGGPGKMN
jgi:hypothetical protein